MEEEPRAWKVAPLGAGKGRKRFARSPQQEQAPTPGVKPCEVPSVTAAMGTSTGFVGSAAPCWPGREG